MEDTSEDAIASIPFSQNEFLSAVLRRRLLGMAWADTEFVVQGTIGELAWWMTPGDHLTQDLAPFIGLDDDLNELRDDFRPSFVLSNVGVNVEVGDEEKVSLEVFWQEQSALFVIVVHRIGGQPEFEADMARQLRGRRLAEEQLALAQRQAQEKQELLDIVAEHAPVALAVRDLKQAIQFATRRWIEVHGADGNVASNKGATFEPYAIGLAGAFEGHETSSDLSDPSTFRRDTGAESVRAWSHQPWTSSQGAVEGVVSVTYPVDAWAAEHARLKSRVQDLERVNGDLESFAVHLAHDVRAPIAALRARLNTAEAESLSDVTREVDLTLGRVAQITDGLLEFATASRMSGPAHAVDIAPMVQRIGEDCIAGTQMRFSMDGTWPILKTAVAPLDIVLRNLIQNAVRHHDTGHGNVSVTATVANGGLSLVVADDGPGIPAERHAQIFEPMKTFAMSDVSSTGLGLAFVRRAAESVNAKITLESDPDVARGARFLVQWPVFP